MTDKAVKKPAEPDDPMALMGVAMPTGPEGDEAMATMAESLADEFLRMGYSQQQVMQMFRDPFFRMTHAIWRAWGEEKVRAVVKSVARRWQSLAPEDVTEMNAAVTGPKGGA
ncbi:MAG: hypothetical protein GY953_26210 [bacterium]|nr:hypothetical protein [bacterium]